MCLAYSIFASITFLFNWSMGNALVSRVDEGGMRKADRDPICATIEVLWDNCFGRDQHVSNRNSNNGTMRSTSLNSDAVKILVDLVSAIAITESQTFLTLMNFLINSLSFSNLCYSSLLLGKCKIYNNF